MYRFNGVDNRLERELESVLMVMESFEGFESKIKYDIIGNLKLKDKKNDMQKNFTLFLFILMKKGHSGDG
jgi:hypothetical protein